MVLRQVNIRKKILEMNATNNFQQLYKTFLAILAAICVFFSCQSYNEGIMVEVENPVLPVLTGKEHNPVMKIILIPQQPEDYTLQKITVSMEGTTDLNDIEHISLFKSDGKGNFATDSQIGEAQTPASTVIFKDDFNVTDDTLTFWLSVTLKDNIDLTHRVKAQLKGITADIGKIRIPDTDGQSLRVGVAVRQLSLIHI